LLALLYKGNRPFFVSAFSFYMVLRFLWLRHSGSPYAHYFASWKAEQNEALVIMLSVRVARFFLVQNTYKTGENIPNGHKIFPMAVKETKWS
jgi:hypothetical protein